jgi:phosphatidylinositol-3-phosphatase
MDGRDRRQPVLPIGNDGRVHQWDEDDYSQDNHIAMFVVSPYTPAGTTSGAPYNHYSLLRTTEELLGLTTYLGNSATAASMRSAFGLGS